MTVTHTPTPTATQTPTATATPTETATPTVTPTTPANQPPVITEGASKAVSMDENGSPVPFALTLHATDADHDPLTWSILTPPFKYAYASVVAGAGVVTYSPPANYNGGDSFVVQVSDGHGGADSITVNVTIRPRPYTGDLHFNQSYQIQYDTWLGPLAKGAGGLANAFEPAFGAAAPNLIGPFGSGYRRAVSGTFTFKPAAAFTQIKWITYRGPDQGKAQVLVDGAVKATVDLYNAKAQWQYLVTVSGLTNAKHTVVIKALNTRNALSKGNWVVVDGFTIGATNYDDNLINTTAVALTYGSWLGAPNTAALDGGYRISSTANAATTFSFWGVTFDWITARGPAYGKAQVWVDGVLKQTVDLYKATQQWQSKVTISGLTYGPHTVIIKALGAKNPASTGAGVVIDGFIIN
jgi:hypothetical protein